MSRTAMGMPAGLEDPAALRSLVVSATRDEVEAFGVFYRRHCGWVLAFVARRVGDAELAADITSEVFAAAMPRSPAPSSTATTRPLRSPLAPPLP